MKFPTNVCFYNKDLIYPDTNCAYKVIDDFIYYVNLNDAVCGVNNEENYTLGHSWWNDRTNLFDWQKVNDWSKHTKNTWSNRYLIINLLKKITPKIQFFNNE